MLNLKIRTQNQAFDNSSYEECARILEECALKLRDGEKEGKCIDINGNVVGHYTLTRR